MPNINYIKGVRKERQIVNDARTCGLIAFRSAGSFGIIDVVVIDVKKKEIKLIQSKPDTMATKARLRLEEKHSNLNNMFKCSFEVL